jgi:hypothetical protein
MSETTFSRNIFIDSNSNTIGSTGAVRVVLQPAAFTIKPDQQMALTLRTFEMRYSMYNINYQNNCLCWYNPVGATFTPILIPEGSYIDFTVLAAGIQAGFVALPGFAGTTCTYSAITRKFTITVAGPTPTAQPTGYLVSFLVKNGVQPAGITNDQFFNDSNEIYGCLATTTFAVPADAVNAFNQTGVGAYVSLYPAALTTLEAIYVRLLNINTNNYSTIGYDFSNPQLTGTVLTSIIARIPLEQAVYDLTKPFITYVEQGSDKGNFVVYLQQKTLDNLVIILTDPNGRPLPQAAPNQFSTGHLNYTMSIGWEVIHEPPYAGKVSSISDLRGSYAMPRI